MEKGKKTIITVLPLRRNSSRVYKKNFRLVDGKPLYSYAVKAWRNAQMPLRSQLFLYTSESDYICESDSVYLKARSDISDTDTISTEDSLQLFLKDFLKDFIVDENTFLMLLQATSPLITSSDIESAISMLDNFDSVVSVVKDNRFIWTLDKSGKGQPINYNLNSRPLSQNNETQFVENGALYVTRMVDFLETNLRLNGKIGLLEMSPDSLIEVDTELDLFLVEQLLKYRKTVLSRG